VFLLDFSKMYTFQEARQSQEENLLTLDSRSYCSDR